VLVINLKLYLCHMSNLINTIVTILLLIVKHITVFLIRILWIFVVERWHVGSFVLPSGATFSVKK